MNKTEKAALSEKQAAAPADLEEINRHTLRQLSAEEVFTFRVAACDNQIDRDCERFSDLALEEMAELYPGKPVILDHNWSAHEQCARVYGAQVEPDPVREGVKRLILRCYIPRLEATQTNIEAIETGLKRECSVGCAVRRSVCSICGEDYYNGDCIHCRGREYDGKLCHVILDGCEDAYEVSFVAVPAQREAGVVKSGEEKPREDWKKSAKARLGLEQVRFGAVRR